ncbi:TonB-dependent receptor, partial [Steroidobacter sp.]|uniref:TonB-dependent receptor n=1 Tax=Steroidobacter sp. TaxID=1978227 RepID=UPI001A37BE1A
AVAGAVRFITGVPKLDKIEGKVAADVSFIDGGDSNEKISGVLNLPLVTDKLAVRIAATGEQGGGWIDQPAAGIEDGNNQDITNVRVKMRWLPTENLTLDLTAASYHLTSELGLDYETADHRVNMPISDDRRIRRRLDEYGLYSLAGTYDLGFAEIIATTSYIDYYREYTLPYFAGEGTYSYANGSQGISTYDDQSYQSSQEVRLVSKGDSAFKYTAGAYHRKVKSDYYGLTDGLYDGFLFTNSEYIEKYQSDSWSFFADGSIKVGERGEIGAGVRSFRDRVTSFGGFPLATYQDTFTSTDPRVYGSYALTDNVKLYANVAKGFRSGGFNLFPAVAYGPEKAINYEIGSKGVIPGARLSYEVAAFFTDYDDMLRRGVVQRPGGAFQNLTSNIGRAEIKGLEVGFGWRPADSLMLSVSGTYLDGEVVEVKAVNRPGEITSANQVGDKVDYVPKFSYTFAADYSFAWAAGVSGFLHLDLNHRDEVYYTDAFLYVPGAVEQSSDSFTLLGARIGATWQQISVELFGNNLTNENKLVDPFDIWSQANRTKPRTFGVKTTYSF